MSLVDENTLNELYPTTASKVGVVVSAVGSLTMAVAAARSARRGNYSQALFRAVVWGVISNNTNNDLKIRIALADRKSTSVNIFGDARSMSGKDLADRIDAHLQRKQARRTGR